MHTGSLKRQLLVLAAVFLLAWALLITLFHRETRGEVLDDAYGQARRVESEPPAPAPVPVPGG